MNKLDRQARMMDYLYGEMNPEERLEYERRLEDHPETQQEIAELQNSRHWLADVEELTPRPMIIELPEQPRLHRKWFYRAAAVAAVLLACWLFNFQVRMDQGGLMLSFGHPESTKEAQETAPVPTADDQLETWKQLLAGNQQLLEEKMLHMDSAWQHRFAGLQQENRQQWTQVKNIQAGQVQQVQQEFTQQQLPRLAALMQQLQSEQQEELRLLLVEFWNTWQETRQTDLERIDFKMTNLYQNVEFNQKAAEARVVNYLQNVAGR